MKEKVPVLIIAFNRIDVLKSVFKTVELYEPSDLFLFADGWRKDREGEKEKCEGVRNYLLNNIGWDCNVRTYFPDENLGCGKGPASAISWFFNNIESGIILEDDCVPHEDFYEYARILLDKYYSDESVMAINSSNFQPCKRSDGSYYFSMQNGPFCAWATWKRAWRKFDYDMNSYTSTLISRSMSYYNVTRREKKWWIDIFNYLKSDRNDGSAWDYQFIFSIWINHGKSIVPNVNLSTNIGFGEDATHTTNADSVTANRPTKAILPINHPSDGIVCRDADLYYHDFYYDKFVDHTPFYVKLKRKIKKMIFF